MKKKKKKKNESSKLIVYLYATQSWSHKLQSLAVSSLALLLVVLYPTCLLL